ncbi:MAG: hypothetical protein EB833_00065 [Thaumarchaeota archaeon S13]|nr:MAG: hypothetical protein EB833_00065 [Thaumarchaeota archaeon S13]
MYALVLMELGAGSLVTVCVNVHEFGSEPGSMTFHMNGECLQTFETNILGGRSSSSCVVSDILSLSPIPAAFWNGAALGASPVGGRTVTSSFFDVADVAPSRAASASADPAAPIARAATVTITSASPPERIAQQRRFQCYIVIAGLAAV